MPRTQRQKRRAKAARVVEQAVARPEFGRFVQRAQRAVNAWYPPALEGTQVNWTNVATTDLTPYYVLANNITMGVTSGTTTTPLWGETSGSYTPAAQWFTWPAVQDARVRPSAAGLWLAAPERDPRLDIIEEVYQIDAEQDARHAALRLEHQRANERAEKLLNEHLSPAQREELRLYGWFHVETIAANGETRRYRIRRGRHGNIDQVSTYGARIIKSLCVHPTLNVPDADTMLAQMLWLQFGEAEILQVANHFNIRQAAAAA